MANYDLTNFHTVATYLTLNEIKYELDICLDGWQIGVPRLPRHGNCDFDIIIHRGSYGHEDGLLEVMGCISEAPDDDVEGYLDAADVVIRIERNYLHKENK